MKTLKINTLKATGIIAFILAFSAMGLSQSFVLDLQYNPMSFTNANRTIITNTGNNGENVGSVHKYSNVVTVDEITVYALMTILEKNNAGIINFDDDVQTGDNKRFQPRISAGNGGGYILYQLEFFNVANDESAFIFNYWLTGVDVDGSSSSNGYREYAEIGGYSSYQLDASTQLTVSTNSSTGRTRFEGRQGSLSGVTFDNTASYIANFSNANNKITFALGITKQNDERYFSVQLGAPDIEGPFDDPADPVINPLPLAIDDVSPTMTGAGGIAIDNVLDNDTYEGTVVTTDNVNISIVTNPPSGIIFNTSTGEVSVTSGTAAGEYSFIYRICLKSDPSSCDVATVTVTVVSADLQILKTASVTEVEQGLSYSYTITVTNNGLSTAIDAIVDDAISTNLTIVNATPSIGTWDGSTWTIGDMHNGDVANLVLGVETSDSFTGNIDNIATVSSSTYDPDDSNNTSSVSVEVTETIPVINNFPSTGYGTLAFEDLWPGKGDYDFNDLVLDYKFEINTNSENYITEVIGTFVIKAFGAGLENGFGFQLSENIDQTSLSVSGSHLTEGYISLAGNGVEAGQSKPTIIVFDNAYNEMSSPGGAIGVNTTIGATYVDPETITIEITFPADTYTSTDLNIAGFNPFLITNLDRDVEVHLPNYLPTDLAEESYFGTADDDSSVGGNKYYKTANNLPWAINIYESFDYPKEKANIIDTHLKFVEWATSGGTEVIDWYQEKNGYRNTGNIYVE